MSESKRTTHLTSETGAGFFASDPTPGVLLAHAPPQASPADRVRILPEGVTLGRGEQTKWRLQDSRLSKLHATVRLQNQSVWLSDLGSTNGTYVNGARLGGEAVLLRSGDVVRCGNCVFVVCDDLMGFLIQPADSQPPGLTGPFYAPVILSQLAEAAVVGRHVLLSGESGSGKELAARLLSQQLAADEGNRLIAHNCARFSSEEEAVSALFGVSSNAFTGVRARTGLLEQAANGVLFLDEVHVLPVRVQRSLLRFMEDGVFARVGEPATRPLQVKLILGTNFDVDVAISEGLIAFDLANRLQRVHVPALNQRRADVPAIFIAQLRQVAQQRGLDDDALVSTLRSEHLEALCLVDYSQVNVRALIHLAEAYAARVAVRSTEPQRALGSLLAEQYPNNPVVRRARGNLEPAPDDEERPSGWSHYQRHRAVIIETYRSSGHNLSATVRLLQRQSIRTSRRWLAKYLVEWGER